MKILNFLKNFALFTSVIGLGLAGVIWTHEWSTGLDMGGYAGAALVFAITSLALTAVICCWLVGKEAWRSMTGRQPLNGRRNGAHRDQASARLREITIRLERAERLGDIRQESMLMRATPRMLLPLIKRQETYSHRR